MVQNPLTLRGKSKISQAFGTEKYRPWYFPQISSPLFLKRPGRGRDLAKHTGRRLAGRDRGSQRREKEPGSLRRAGSGDVPSGSENSLTVRKCAMAKLGA